jgi:hypothetical protein
MPITDKPLSSKPQRPALAIIALSRVDDSAASSRDEDSSRGRLQGCSLSRKGLLLIGVDKVNENAHDPHQDPMFDPEQSVHEMNQMGMLQEQRVQRFQQIFDHVSHLPARTLQG